MELAHTFKTAKLALLWLESHSLAANAANFSVALALHSDDCPSEITALKTLASDKIDQPLLDEMYNYCQVDSHNADAINQQLSELIHTTIDHIQSGSRNSDDLVNSINSTQKKAESTTDINNLLGEFTKAIERVQQHQSQLTCRLQEVENKANHLKRELEESKKQAVTDPVTGIKNRYALKEHAKPLLANGTEFSLIIFDIDHFKRFNDSFGHLVGDKVLRRVAEELEAEISDIDITARYGGEEFIVLCPNKSIETAIELAESIRNAVSKLRLRYRDHSLPRITISGGVSISHPNETLEDVIERADNALYRAKNSGRNNIKAMADNSFN